MGRHGPSVLPVRQLQTGRGLSVEDVDAVVGSCMDRYAAAKSGEYYPPALEPGNSYSLPKL